MLTEEFGESYELSIYPNPSLGQFKLYLNGMGNGEDVTIDIVDGMGIRVFSSEYMSSDVQIDEEIDLNDVAPGLYFLNLQVGSTRISKRIMIVK